MRVLIILKYYGQRISFAIACVSFLIGIVLDNGGLLLVATISTLLCVAFFKWKIEL
jgi:hypothetical protein